MATEECSKQSSFAPKYSVFENNNDKKSVQWQPRSVVYSKIGATLTLDGRDETDNELVFQINSNAVSAPKHPV